MTETWETSVVREVWASQTRPGVVFRTVVGVDNNEGTSDHSVLTNRAAADQHPIGAVTGLQVALDGKVSTSDQRLSDARTPTAHKSTHGTGGTDEIAPADIGAVPVEAVGMQPGWVNKGAWGVGIQYHAGDVVTTPQPFVAVSNNLGDHPTDGSGAWAPVTSGTALGPGAAVSGGFSAAVAPGSTASGDFCSAFGPAASASGDGSLSVGTMSSSSGASSAAVGYASAALGDLSAAVGPGATTSGKEATAVGYTASASGEGSVALGAHAAAPNDGDVNLAGIITGNNGYDSGVFDPAPIVVLGGGIDLPETADVTDPPVGSWRLVSRPTGLFIRADDGAEIGPIDASTPQINADWSASSGVAEILHKPTIPSAPADIGAAEETHAHAAADVTSGVIAPARLGTGTADATTVLHGDGTWGAGSGGGGQAWAMSVPPTSGLVQAPHRPNVNMTAFGSVGEMTLIPCTVLNRPYIGMVIRVMQGGDVGEKVRLGIYERNDDGTCGQLLVDAGTVDTDSVGSKVASMSFMPTGPNVYLACVQQGPTVTARFLGTNNNTSYLVSGVANVSNFENQGKYAVYGVTGALPNAPLPTLVSGFGLPVIGIY